MSETAKPRGLGDIRVLDLTWVRAGPWATRLLATMGVDVIKVEWPSAGAAYLNDRRQTLGQPEDTVPTLNNSFWFSEKNAGKRSVTLNARHPAGLDLMRRLIKVSDVVIENFTAGVMASWGLGYEDMCGVRPDIIYVSLSALGHTGPDRKYRTYGPSAQALAGLTYLSGLPDHSPAGWGWSYLDDTGGILGASFALAALHHRERTGEGQHVDMSQVGAGIPLAGPAVLDATVNGRPARRDGFPPGNRSVWPGAPVLHNYRGRIAAPHNAYRTAGGGYNDWCAIVCETDEQWQSLVGVMGTPEWACDPWLATLDGRLARQADLDERIEEWTLTLDRYALAERCQAAGVPAMPVQSNEDRVERDPQLRARRNLEELPHPELGPMRYQNLPFESPDLPRTTPAAAALIGEHNREVYCDLLGLSKEELRGAYEAGALWPEDLEMPPSLRSQVEALS